MTDVYEIPGPRLPALVQTALLFRDPVRFLEACRRRHGPVFRVRLMGFPRYVYVADPLLAREVYAADRTVARAGDGRRDFLAPLVGEHSLLCTEDEQWLRHRRLLGPVFHRKHVDGYAEEIAAIAGAEIERWPLGVPFELRPRMQDITLEVILRLVFGVSDAERLDRFRAALPRLMDVTGGPLLWLVPPFLLTRERTERRLRRFPNPLRTFLETRDEVDGLIYDEIARRRREPDEGRRDVLSMLLRARDDEGRGMSDVELRDELVTLLEAGHETTATGLAWAFERLLRHPDTDEFRPERFLGDDPPRDGWIPFGGGKRHCVGSHLALLEMRVVIAEVLRRLRLEPGRAEPERQRMHHVTLVPSERALVVASERAGRRAA